MAFVLPPDRIDVDLCHAILETAVRVDADPFTDFEYGFITGRDGDAALRFVLGLAAARTREFKKKAALFGSWEGMTLPGAHELSSLAALGFEGKADLVLTRSSEAERRKKAREALSSYRGLDALMFFSHGYPDAMSACFRAKDLRDWQIDFSPAVLVNCACYNGAPGRWYAPGPGGMKDMGLVTRDDSVALAVLDAGVSAYVAGIDPWHGPLANQVREAGGAIRMGVRVAHLKRTGSGWQAIVNLGDASTYRASQIILATDSPGTEAILEASPDTSAGTDGLYWPRGLATAVVRIWFDRAPRGGSEAGILSGDFVPDSFFWLHRIHDPYIR